MQYVNRSYKLTGTLWDSRYKSSVIQAETYLLTRHRYFEINPVHAAMVDDPAHCRWTSHRHNKMGATDSRITPHTLDQAPGQTDKNRQTDYRALFRARLDAAAIDNIRLSLNQNQPLGNARFYARKRRRLGRDLRRDS